MSRFRFTYAYPVVPRPGSAPGTTWERRVMHHLRRTGGIQGAAPRIPGAAPAHKCPMMTLYADVCETGTVCAAYILLSLYESYARLYFIEKPSIW